MDIPVGICGLIQLENERILGLIVVHVLLAVHHLQQLVITISVNLVVLITPLMEIHSTLMIDCGMVSSVE